VRGVLLRLCGQNSGVKLWDVRSIEHWIRGEMENSFPARSTTRKIPRLSGNWISLKFFILAAEVTRLYLRCCRTRREKKSQSLPTSAATDLIWCPPIRLIRHSMNANDSSPVIHLNLLCFSVLLLLMLVSSSIRTPPMDIQKQKQASRQWRGRKVNLTW